MLCLFMIQSRQIEAFRAVMRTGSMTTAAEMIHVTQPAVSRLIRDLEAEIGLDLFDRRGNLVAPTAQAHALMAEVERSFVGLGQIKNFADNLRTGRAGSLRLGALPAMSGGFLPRFVAGFSRDRPGLKVLVDGLPSSVIRDRVVAGQFDLGVVSTPFQRDSLTVTPLNDPTVVAMPIGHRLTAKTAVRAEDLHDETLIVLSKFFSYGQHPVGLALQPVRRTQWIETPLASIACVFVSEGMGVAIVDPFSASEFVGKGIVLRPFVPAMMVGSALVHASDRPLSILAAEFHAAFLEHVQDFLTQADYLRF
jgi:DNA-binding transcriptional LysR family regulator